MPFPTIPTVASGDLLSSTTSPASTTHTFPNLSSLRGGAGPQAGDLLIAICVQYGAATAGNQYSSWGASFSETLDDSLSSGTGVGAVGIATKVATGSESGTFTVTSATSAKSVQFLMRIPAASWQGTTNFGVQAASRATGAAANPASFNPSWAAEDTLFISVAGQTETTTTGTPPVITTPPSNYSGQLIVARVADAVGDITAGVAFRQLNADSEDVGLWTGTDLNRGNGIASVIAVRGVLPKSTSVAEISLASHGTPSERTNHSIKVRARTTSGSTGVLKAALYEGSTNRSGDLTSSALTNSLADYTLAIPNASAANITDYSNLSIRVWGYDSAGGALVFQVAELYLELPEPAGPATLYGASSLAVSFNRVTAGSITSKKTAVAEISLASHATPSIRTHHNIKLRARTTSGTTGIMRVALYEGSTNRSGDLSGSELTNVLEDRVFPISDVAAATITDYSNLSIRFWGFDPGGAALVFEVSEAYLQLPTAGAATYFGVIDRPFTFVKAVSGSRKTFSQIAAPFTFTRVISGARRTFSQVAAPFTFTRVVSGKSTIFGQVVRPFTFVKSVSATKQTFGQILRPFTFVKDVAARRTAFGQILRPFTFVKDVSARRTTFGQVARPITFGKAVGGISIVINQISRSFGFNSTISGSRKTFSQVASPFTFSRVISGSKQTFGQIVRPFTFVKDVSGKLVIFGQIVRPFTFVKSVSATRQTYAQVVRPFTFVKDVSARRTTFGQVVRPFTFVKSVSAQRIALGQIASSFVFSRVVSGSRRTFGQVVRPFTFVKDVAARRTTFGQVVRPFTFVRVVSGVRSTVSQITASFAFNRVVTARKTTFSRIDLPLIFVEQTSGRKQTFGQIGLPIDFVFDVVAEVQGIRYGQVDMSLVFGKDVKASKKTFGQVSSPYLFERSTQSRRTTFGQIVRPFTFAKAVVGRKTTFGQSALPINASFVIAGRRLAYGQVALSLVLGEQTVGQRKAFGTTTSSYNFNGESAGRKQTFGLLDFPIDFVVDVNTGRVDAFSSLGREFLIAIETAGMVRPTGIILNLAKEIYLGSTPVDAVYVDSQKVWSK